MSATAESTEREVWLAKRRTGIGGSDAAAAVGLSPWKTPLQLYLEKTGEAESEIENDDMRRGTLLEPVVRQLYADATGHSVLRVDNSLVHPEFVFARANLDGIVKNFAKLLECKTARNRAGWGEPGSADIPIYYLCQVQHCLAVAGFPVADVAVLFGTDFEFAIYEIEADHEFQSLLFEREAEFWRMVENRTPPDPSSAADLVRRWPKSHPATAVGGDLEARAAVVLSAVNQRYEELDAIAERAEAILKSEIKDREALEIDGHVVATWKSAKDSKRFNLEAFKAVHPELVERFSYPVSGSRRFLLKEKEVLCLTNEKLTLPPFPSDLLPETQTASA